MFQSGLPRRAAAVRVVRQAPPTVIALVLAALVFDGVRARGAGDGDPAMPRSTGGLASEPLADTVSVLSALVLPNVSAARRELVFVDPIEARMARGDFLPPQEGDAVAAADGTPRLWRRLAADSTGWIQSADLAGGYAYAEILSPTREVRLLDAQGHRHVYVNGEARAGDVYVRGFLRLPVLLEEGRNTLLFRHGWGGIQARLVRPPAPVFIEERDPTLPSVVIGDSAAAIHAGIVVSNATAQWQRDLAIRAWLTGGDTLESPVGSLPPLRVRKVAVAVPVPAELRSSGALSRELAGARRADLPDSLLLHLELRHGEEVLHRHALPLDVTLPVEKHYRSFLSDIDGSVQHYGVTPPPTLADSLVGLVLTCHGAGVPARQAHHYAQRDWAYIVAPTNRREFGFDWEDWGRLDALEVLAEAQRVFAIHPRRRWLTGHSMGGHGTWQLGAHYPDLFGAIAPSAGWRDFWSYGGGATAGAEDPMEALLARASNASRTLLLEKNYLHSAVYVLHGDQDDNVPVDQARFMRERLGAFHPNFAYYERPGAGHWWGDECMDWPPLMEFLRRNPLPATASVGAIDFTTIHPGISSRCFWVSVEEQGRSFEPSNVRARVETRSDSSYVLVETENVARLDLDLAALWPDGTPTALRLEVDGSPVPVGRTDRTVRLELSSRSDAHSSRVVAASPPPAWRIAAPEDGVRKTPRRSGPFKDAFRHHVQLVYGTAGDPESNAALLGKALYDAEVFYYRGNGSFEVLSDEDFLARADTEPDRNVVLYGNAATNRAWPVLLARSPIQIEDGAVAAGGTRLAGDLAVLFIQPRPGSDVASVGVVGATSARAVRALRQAPYFTSGVGCPDWIVLGADFLEEGIDAVRGAGFFAVDWSLGDDYVTRP